MKRKISLIVSIIFCLAFCSMNIVKSSIRDIRFLLTLSSETLANAEAIEGEGEGDETKPNTKKWIRYWDYCTFFETRDYIVQYGVNSGITIKRGKPVPGIEGKAKKVESGGNFRDKPNEPSCADRKKPDGEPYASDVE